MSKCRGTLRDVLIPSGPGLCGKKAVPRSKLQVVAVSDMRMALQSIGKERHADELHARTKRHNARGGPWRLAVTEREQKGKTPWLE